MAPGAVLSPYFFECFSHELSEWILRVFHLSKLFDARVYVSRSK